MDRSPDLFRFGEFELDLDAGELRQKGRRLRVQPQPLRLLALLARRAGRLVGRDEIRRELWPDGTYVDFDQAVNFTVAQIRRVLGDDADHPLYVETVPRKGYRFIAPVQAVQAGARDGHGPPADDSPTTRLQKAVWTNIAELRMIEARRRRHTVLVLALLILVAIVVILVIVAR